MKITNLISQTPILRAFARRILSSTGRQPRGRVSRLERMPWEPPEVAPLGEEVQVLAVPVELKLPEGETPSLLASPLLPKREASAKGEDRTSPRTEVSSSA
jgi:hypothetical protein